MIANLRSHARSKNPPPYLSKFVVFDELWSVPMDECTESQAIGEAVIMAKTKHVKRHTGTVLSTATQIFTQHSFYQAKYKGKDINEQPTFIVSFLTLSYEAVSYTHLTLPTILLV